MAKASVITANEAIQRGLCKASEIPTPERVCPFCGKRLNALCIYTGGFLPTICTHSFEECDCPQAVAQRQTDAIEKAAREAQRAEAEKAERMQRAIDRAFKQSEMPQRWRGYTFERFVPDEGNTTAYTRCQRYAEWIAESEKKHGCRFQPNGVYLSGRSGTGKTHLAAAILNEIIVRCPTAPTLAMSMQELIGRLKQSYDSDDAEVREDELIKTYTDVPILLIDDLGSEQPTEWAADRIFRIVNGRYNNCLPTIVTSNYGVDELAKRLTPRRHADRGDYTDGIKIADRLAEMCVQFTLTGDSHRKRHTFGG